MNILKTFEKTIILIASLITIIASSIVIYDFTKNKNPQLQITKIYSIKKTKEEDKNLYEVRFRIQNIGSNSILNFTQYQNMLHDKLKVEISNIKDFKSTSFISNFEIDDIDFTKKGIDIKFNQWMQNDYLDIICEFEPIDKNKPADMYIDKYQLLNGEVKYSLDLYDDTPIIIIKK